MALTESVRSFQVPATPGTTAWAQFAVGAHLACDPRDLCGKRPELVHHRVDGLLQLQNFAANVDRDVLGQVPIGHRDRDLGNIADLGRQVAGHLVDRIG